MSNKDSPSILAITVLWFVVVSIDAIILTLLGNTVDLGFFLSMLVALVFVIVVTRPGALD